MWLYDKYKKRCDEMSIEEANQKFQIHECDGELWLTFNNCLICPCSMLNVSPVEAVRKMRELYLKRKVN